MVPPNAGLDASWNAGLAMAVKGGLQFGREVVFSYGPLGFLQSQSLWYGDLGVVSFLYSAALYVAFCIAFVWALRRSLPALPAVVIAFVAIAVLPLLEQPVLLPVFACLALLERRRSERTIVAVVVIGGSYAAVEMLVKLSIGPVVAVMLAVALIGARARWWQVLGYVAIVVAELLLFWSITGQSIAAVPAFLENSAQIVSGYSQAMLRQVDVPAWKVAAATIAAALTTIALVVVAARARYRDRRARWCAAAVTALAGFVVFKEGVVRTDAAHLSIYFSTACLLWLAIPWATARWRWMLAGAAVIAAAGLAVRPSGYPTNLDVIANVSYAAEQVHTLASGSRRSELTEAGRQGMKGVYRIDRRMLTALHGHTVAIEPWEIGAAWAYRLDWEPLPVFQNYSAYTSALDRLNADAVERTDGPQLILRENQLLVDPEFPTADLDGRFPGWDPPAQARAVLCNFQPLLTTARWQLLRRAEDRCARPRPIGSVSAAAGATVPVPAPPRNEVVFVRIHGAGVSGLERLSTLLLHARLRHLVVNGSHSYRLIPGTAGDGLMLRSSSGIVEDGPFSPIPQARTISVEGVGGSLRFNFFAVAVRGAADRAPVRSGG
jgi:hypothetical protein